MRPKGMIVRGVATAALAALMAIFEANAQTAPDTDNGRFTLSPVADGFLRLDTRTGAGSTCINKNGWTCRMVPDERAALDSEIGRLQADNKRLTDALAQRDKVAGKTDAPLPKSDSERSAQASPETKMSPDRKIELQLPPEHEKLLALLDRIWDLMIEMAVRLQKRLSEEN